MAQYIDKDALVAEIGRMKADALQKKSQCKRSGLEKIMHQHQIGAYNKILSFLDSVEVREMDLELITGWFDHIAQIADDRMTLTNQRMTDAHALDEIKCLAKNSSEFITKHYKVQKGE